MKEFAQGGPVYLQVTPDAAGAIGPWASQQPKASSAGTVSPGHLKLSQTARPTPLFL